MLSTVVVIHNKFVIARASDQLSVTIDYTKSEVTSVMRSHYAMITVNDSNDKFFVDSKQ